MKIGISKSKITPPEGIELSGFGFYLERKAVGIHDDLFTRALLINNDNHDSMLIISNDIIGLDFTLVEEIKKTLSLNLNIKPQNIYVCCTHTHSGPSTMNLRGCGEINHKYLNFLKNIIIKNATKTEDYLLDVKCKIISSEIINFCYNREKKIPVSRPISILKFNNIKSHNSDLVLLINFSCHPVILRKDNLKFSRDFIGPLIDNLEDESKIKMVIFTNSCCGDIDPLVVRTSKDFLKYKEVKYWGNVLAKEVKDILRKNKGKIVSTDNIKTNLISFKLKYDYKIVDDKLDKSKYFKYPNLNHFFEEVILNQKKLLEKKINFDKEIDIQITKSDGLLFLGLPGEFYSEAEDKIRKRNKDSIIFGYCNGNFGYFPIIKEGISDFYGSKLGQLVYSIFPLKKDMGIKLMEKVLKNI